METKILSYSNELELYFNGHDHKQMLWETYWIEYVQPVGPTIEKKSQTDHLVPYVHINVWTYVGAVGL